MKAIKETVNKVAIDGLMTEKVDINGLTRKDSMSENEHQRHLYSDFSKQLELTTKDQKNDDLPSTILDSNIVRKM